MNLDRDGYCEDCKDFEDQIEELEYLNAGLTDEIEDLKRELDASKTTLDRVRAALQAHPLSDLPALAEATVRQALLADKLRARLNVLGEGL